MSVSLDVSEILDMGHDIRRNADSYHDRAERVMADGADQFVSVGRQLAPVRTGRLVASWGADVDGLSFEGGVGVRYGDEVELGTSDTPAQPSVGPAFDAVTPLVVDELLDEAVQVLR